jgi:SAM-dependent methyltransferase
MELKQDFRTSIGSAASFAKKGKAWMWSKWNQENARPHISRTIQAGVYDLDFDADGTPVFAQFVPKQIKLANPDALTKKDILTRADRASTLGVDHLHEDALPRIQQLQDRWRNATHQASTVRPPDRDLAVERYRQLNTLVKRFIGVELDRDLDDHATLYGYPLGTAPLSDGQKILLQFCVAIHAQAEKLSELIVLMDEPENHLHPGAMLDAIEQIQPALTNGQLWIATHSIPLLAHFDPESIWWMEDGGVEHAGSTPERVLTSLLGVEERAARLNDFLGLPAALAATRFAYQCLLPPAVLTTGSSDPQTTQIGRLLASQKPGERIRILDLGAGRGRLISALREGVQDGTALAERIDYRAFDPDRSNHTECENAIVRVYGDANDRLFHEERDLRAKLDPKSVDVVVMCNVLHEIDVTEWLGLFSEHALIRTALRDDGFLLVVEDTEMRIGERAHQRGFLVLDTAGLNTLFSITEGETRFLRDDARGDGRLQAHLIPKHCLANANSASLKAALTQVQQLAMEEILKLRKEKADYRQGRRHAFHVQQLANAQLGLSVL